jgi:hypothetical protein
MMNKPIIGAFVCSALAGCASTPDVQFHYFAAQATTSVLVAQTIECREDPADPTGKTKMLSIVNAPTVTTSYSSNRDGKHTHTLPTAVFKSSFADSDIKFDWFDDGRLKSVNVTSTGQGESIVKAALAFVGIVGGGAAALPKDDCDALARLGGGKPVTIAYEGTVTYADGKSGATVQLVPASNSKETHGKLAKLLPKLAFRVDPWQTQPTVAEPGASAADTTGTTQAKDIFRLSLNKTALAPVSVLVAQVPTWTGTVVVPTDESYELPIPKPQLFGTQKFGLTLNEAGGVTSLSYSSTAGTAAGFNTLTAMAGAVASPGDAEKAAALKAQADLIAQTTRLAACQAKPAECK